MTYRLQPYQPMLRHFKLFVLLCLVLASPAQAIETGSAVPPLAITTFDGKQFTTAGARGEVVILNIWASWCSYCREEMPALETYYRRHKSKGLRVVAVTIDDESAEAKAREIIKPYSFTGGLGRLSNLAPLGNLSRLPLTFVIDRNGILRKNGFEGDPKINLAKLEKEVTPLLRQQTARWTEALVSMTIVAFSSSPQEFPLLLHCEEERYWKFFLVGCQKIINLCRDWA